MNDNTSGFTVWKATPILLHIKQSHKKVVFNTSHLRSKIMQRWKDGTFYDSRFDPVGLRRMCFLGEREGFPLHCIWFWRYAENCVVPLMRSDLSFGQFIGAYILGWKSDTLGLLSLNRWDLLLSKTRVMIFKIRSQPALSANSNEIKIKICSCHWVAEVAM